MTRQHSRVRGPELAPSQIRSQVTQKIGFGGLTNRPELLLVAVAVAPLKHFSVSRLAQASAKTAFFFGGGPNVDGVHLKTGQS